MNAEHGETMFQKVPILNELLNTSMRQFESTLTDCGNSSTSTTNDGGGITATCDGGPHRERSVSFSSEVQVHPVINRMDLSEEEKRQTWLTRYEAKQSKQVVSNTIFLMKTGAGASLTEEDYFCSRGLERCVDDEYGARVKKSLRIALAMQRVLKRVGKSSPEMIAKAYRSYTLRSRKAAYRKALEDQTAASSR